MKTLKITIGILMLFVIMSFVRIIQKPQPYSETYVYAPIDSLITFIFDNQIDSTLELIQRNHLNSLYKKMGQDTLVEFLKIGAKGFDEIQFDTFDIKYIDTLIKLLDDTLSCPYTVNNYNSNFCYDSLSSSIQIETACLIKGLQMKKYPFYFCSKDAIDSLSTNSKAYIRESTKQELIKWLKSR